MDVQVNKESIFKLQLRNPKVFKLNTKKAYMVEVPEELQGTDKFFSAFIEFEEVEIFKK